MNEIAGEIRTEVFDALDYLESPQNGLSINFAGHWTATAKREALAGSQRELGTLRGELIDNGLVQLLATSRNRSSILQANFETIKLHFSVKKTTCSYFQ